MRAIGACAQRRYEGAVTIFVPDESTIGLEDLAVWRRMVSDVEFVPVAGNHTTCITTYVRPLATRLAALVDELDAVRCG